MILKGENFVVTSQEFSNTKNWCVVTEKNSRIKNARKNKFLKIYRYVDLELNKLEQ